MPVAPAPRTVELTVVDAFTADPFTGNPAAVCVLDTPAPESWMRSVAAEMNLSETAFLLPVGERRWSLRWFTPTTEVELCGHATLAATRVLADRGLLPGDVPARFETRSGVLRARAAGGEVIVDLPAIRLIPGPPAEGLLAALGLDATTVVATAEGGGYALVEVTGTDVVVALSPDHRRLAALEASVTIVTAPGGRADICSRVFAPAVGINEDPVTGSAHCILGPWYANRLGTEIRAHQASARGGELVVRTLGDRVELTGRAVTTAWVRILGPS